MHECLRQHRSQISENCRKEELILEEQVRVEGGGVHSLRAVHVRPMFHPISPQLLPAFPHPPCTHFPQPLPISGTVVVRTP